MILGFLHISITEVRRGFGADGHLCGKVINYEGMAICLFIHLISTPMNEIDTSTLQRSLYKLAGLYCR